MIQLFNIPSYIIDTGQFSNLLHDNIVKDFEKSFARYVGAKYAVSFNSATSAILLIAKYICKYDNFFIPTIIPPVVPNAILNAGKNIFFVDNTEWVGGSYKMDSLEDFSIIDSAQRVDKGQYKKEGDDGLMIFSFYPTKPIGSCDGGMVVSNDEDKIERLRELTMNGMSFHQNNWERTISSVGHKMYMNSIQAFIANENFKLIDEKKKKVRLVRDRYNVEFGLKNKSDHLYRIRVDNNEKFITFMKKNGIVCGIHYKPVHTNPLYKRDKLVLHKSELDGETMVSIPLHEGLSDMDVAKIIYKVNEYRRV